jgi:hypothetical protein
MLGIPSLRPQLLQLIFGEAWVRQDRDLGLAQLNALPALGARGERLKISYHRLYNCCD